MACLLADADGRIGPGPGVAFRADGRLRLSSRPGSVVDASEPHRRLVAARGAGVAGRIGEVDTTHEYVLDLDLDAPAPEGAEPLELDTSGELYSLAPSLAELTILTVAGPGVVRDGQVDALRLFAEQAGCGVLNTWGAKGVLRWDSTRTTSAPAACRRRDAELAGVFDADIIVAVGIDPDESRLADWGLGQVLDVEPWQLPALAFTWPEPAAEPERSRLYLELSGRSAPYYASDDVPLAPARARGRPRRHPPGRRPRRRRPRAGRAVGRPGVPDHRAGQRDRARHHRAGLRGRGRAGRRPRRPHGSRHHHHARRRHHHRRPRPGPRASARRSSSSSGAPRTSGGAPTSSASCCASAWRGELEGVVAIPVDLEQTSVLVDVAGPVVAWMAG